ncbi:MAG: hypothetical protein ACI8PZ_002294 [Myxococcota bacterium]|jgi:hypothetical protein
MRATTLLLFAMACGASSRPQAEPEAAVMLHAERASLALRGVRPSPTELEQLADDPMALDGLVASWVDDPRFLATVRDLHAQVWWLRSDTNTDPPAAGPLLDVGQAEIEAAFQEEPLRLVSDIVAAGRPYSDVVTATHTMIDPILAAAYGLPYDPAGPEWQAATYEDGRPSAGVLSTNGLWLRHVSGEANAHRSRAAWVTRSLLCDDLGARDLPITAIPHEESAALRDDVACQGCHKALDPIASSFFGFEYALRPGDMREAWARDCQGEHARACYPLQLYAASEAWTWQSKDMPPPGFYGLPADHLGELGREIAADPRFASCTAQHVWTYLTQAPDYGVIPPDLDTLATGFTASGLDLKWLAAAVVMSESFATAPPQVLRPEQLDRWLEDLTGFTWETGQTDCTGPTPCGGLRGMLTSDELGLRTLAGGQDGWDVVTSVHAPTPTQQLVLATAAELAAAHVVGADLAVPSDERRLLTLVPSGSATTEPRPQLKALAEAILGQHSDSALVDALVPVWTAARDRHGDDAVAWELVIALLLQDPAAWVY